MWIALYLTLFLVGVCSLAILVGKALKAPPPPRRDQVINLDQWSEERRRGLVNMQRPAAKGFAHQRHTVLAYRDRQVH